MLHDKGMVRTVLSLNDGTEYPMKDVNNSGSCWLKANIVGSEHKLRSDLILP